MSLVRQLSIIVELAVLTGPLTGCHGVGFTVPPQLAAAPRLEVTGRSDWGLGRQLEFGTYRAERRESSMRLMAVAATLRVGEAVAVPIGFRLLAHDTLAWMVACDTILLPAETVAAATLPADTAASGMSPPETASSEARAAPNAGANQLHPQSQDLRCVLRPAARDVGAAWRLSVRYSVDAPPGGELVGPEGARLVVLGGRWRDARAGVVERWPAGYQIVEGETPLAAIEVTGRGGVWFDPRLSAERRDLIAATGAAIMLWDALLRGVGR